MAQDSSSPRVELAPDTGLIGSVVKAYDREDVPVYAFKGIPYAQPPVGELRFKDPEPVELWTGDRQATEYGAICPQDTSMLDRMPWTMTIPDKMSEDCLFLNVWTPSLDQGARKPVMVWIHGGGFAGGWGDCYEGTGLCSYEDVVFVSINYRLGIFGFLSTGDDVVPGNFGLKDQIESLRWVQKYIHRFGGDPNNVTIFGESAGGISVSALLLSDLAAGLFHKAISQSGTAGFPGMVLSQAYARRSLTPLLHRMGLVSDKSEDILTFLQGQSMDTILKNLQPTDTFRPVVDNSVLQDEHMVTLRNEKSSNIPYITGCNGTEGALFSQLMLSMQIPNMEACNKALMIPVGTSFNPLKIDVPALLGTWMEEYFKDVTDEDLIKKYTELMGDLWFVYPCIEAADSHLGPTFTYHMTLTPSASKQPSWVTCDHAAEISFTLGRALYDNSHHSPDWNVYSEEEVQLTKQIIKYWANFARTGDPNGAGLPEWPRYEQTNKTHLLIDHPISTGKNLRAARVDFWRKNMDKFGAKYID